MSSSNLIITLTICLATFAFLVDAQKLSSEECPEHSTFNRCMSRCPTTCLNINSPPINCLQVCTVGCECNPGFVKVNKSPNSPCVREYECSLYAGKKTLPYQALKKLMAQRKMQQELQMERQQQQQQQLQQQQQQQPQQQQQQQQPQPQVKPETKRLLSMLTKAPSS